jgi:hypothetical protein
MAKETYSNMAASKAKIFIAIKIKGDRILLNFCYYLYNGCATNPKTLILRALQITIPDFT